jgi:hypothetical protein
VAVNSKWHAGCNVCKTVGNTGDEKVEGPKLRAKWTGCAVSCNGTYKTQQQASLRKKSSNTVPPKTTN